MAPEKKKRQHYVPRLILRGFSRDGTTTSVLMLQSGESADGASISRQCYENYFYGEDGKVEESLAKIESLFSGIVGDRSPERLAALTADDMVILTFFIQLQRGRTVAAAEQMSEQTDSFWKAAFAGDPRLNDLGLSLDQFRIGSERPQGEALYYAVLTWPFLLDLKLKVLVPNGKLGFVVSDDPVILYNQFAEHHPVYRHHPPTVGLAMKGLQVYLPLSPRLCLALFDTTAYEFGSPTRGVCSLGLRDVRLLNEMQALNAHECLYFDRSEMNDGDLRALVKARRAGHGWRRARIYKSEEFPEPDGTTGQIIGLSQPALRVGKKLGCVTVTGAASEWDPPELPRRATVLTELASEHANLVSGWRQEAEGAAGGRETSPA